MASRTPFPVLVATDGSRPGRAAVTAATRFPWPRGSRARGLVARSLGVAVEATPAMWDALEQSFARAAADARRLLRVRWPDAEVDVVEGGPVEAILAAARRQRAGAIVVGSRGHGALTRLVLGSVSLGIVRRAACPVLVVKGRPRLVERLALGVDGSPHARHAAEFVARLAVPRGGHVTLIAVVEPVRPPTTGLMPSTVRSHLLAQAAALEGERLAKAERHLEAAARVLRRAGWPVTTEARLGVPLAELLARTQAARAQVLVVGARGVGGVERLLLGSVAEGALSRASLPVLVVR